MDFKYTQIFSSKVKCLISEEKDIYLAQASTKDLTKFLPKVNEEENVDLLPVAFNAFIANRFNKNDDGVDSESAVSLAKLFINKPINIEHNRDKVVGVVLSYAFTELGSDKQLTEEEALASTKPFNVTLGGVLWRIVNKNLAKFVEDASDPSSDNFEEVSASWELGFLDYCIAVIDGNSKNFEDAEFITDSKEIELLHKKLRAFGGSGKLELNKKIYRKVCGDKLPLGIGFTDAPAAEVKGIATPVTLEKVDETKASETILEKNKENISQSKEINVVNERKAITKMKISKIEDITDENLKQVAASELSEWVKQEIAQAGTKFAEEKDKLQKTLNESVDKANQIEAQLTEANKKLEEVTKNVEALAKEKEAREKQDKFNVRMSKFDEKFNLSKEERQVIASEIAEIEDAKFEDYEKRVEVLLASKKKGQEAPVVEKKVEEIKASENKTQVVEAAIENGKKEATVIPNSSSPTEKNTEQKFKEAFAVENWISDVDLK